MLYLRPKDVYNYFCSRIDDMIEDAPKDLSPEERAAYRETLAKVEYNFYEWTYNMKTVPLIEIVIEIPYTICSNIFWGITNSLEYIFSRKK